MKTYSKNTITFGLISANVKLFASKSSSKVAFKSVDAKGRKLSQHMTNPVGTDIPFKERKKGYEYKTADGETSMLVIEKSDLATLPADKKIAIEQFVDLDEIDPILFQSSYFLAPDEGGNQAFAILAHAMVRTGKVAVAKWINRGSDNLCVIRPYGGEEGSLVLTVLSYGADVREYKDVPFCEGYHAPTEQEIALGASLIEKLAGGELFNHEDHVDRVQVATRQMIEDRIAGKVPEKATVAPMPKVDDLMAALQASLEAA